MDHPFESVPTTLPQGFWRTAAVVAILVAAVELVLLIVTGTALIFRHSDAPPAARAATTGAKATAATPATAKRHHAVAKTKLTRKQVTVLVLNGNGRPGSAAGAAARVRQHGYTIRSVGNATRMSYPHSLVMYRPGYEGEGRRLAHDLGIRRVGPLDGMRPVQMHGAKAVLIVGA